MAIWRLAPHWYLVALGLPAALSLGAAGLSLGLGAPGAVQFSELSPLTLLLFVLVIGEELAWRGFALPRLRARYGALGGSLILGLLWAGWHLPNQLIPGLEYYGYGFPAFTLYVLPMGVCPIMALCPPQCSRPSSLSRRHGQTRCSAPT